MKEIQIVTLEPIYRFADGSPKYNFHTSFPTTGVREVGPICATPEEAYAHGQQYVADYERRDPYGNMGQVIGVTEKDGTYRAVVNTYHSNT